MPKRCAPVRVLAYSVRHGVETVTPISQKKLDFLASWLCATTCAAPRADPPFEEHGRHHYCKYCRDIAGNLLSVFEVAVRRRR